MRFRDLYSCSTVIFRNSNLWHSKDFMLLYISEIRRQELRYLKGRKYLDALCVYFWATTPVVISILTFSTYTIMGNKLTAATVSKQCEWVTGTVLLSSNLLHYTLLLLECPSTLLSPVISVWSQNNILLLKKQCQFPFSRGFFVKGGGGWNNSELLCKFIISCILL